MIAAEQEELNLTLSKNHPDFPSRATLEDLAAISAHFQVPLSILRRERELKWDAFDVPPADRPAVMALHREKSLTGLIAWLDCMREFDLLTLENHQELVHQILELFIKANGTAGD